MQAQRLDVSSNFDSRREKIEYLVLPYRSRPRAKGYTEWEKTECVLIGASVWTRNLPFARSDHRDGVVE
jgi:hypothetical protein